MSQPDDTVVRRLTVDYGHWYVYLTLADANGKLVEEEVFKQPFRLNKKDIGEESKDGFNNIYQWILDTTVFTASSDDNASDLE